MSDNGNPYEASSSDDRLISSRQWCTALFVALIVVFASGFTMLAFLFGTFIAFAGRSHPSPLDFSAIIAGPSGRILKLGALAIVPVSLMLGLYCFFRITRVQRSIVAAAARRNDLLLQLKRLRETRNATGSEIDDHEASK